jgi:hypothetical protein
MVKKKSEQRQYNKRNVTVGEVEEIKKKVG